MAAQEHVAGVRFRGARRIFYYDAGDLDLQLRNFVVVDSEQGRRVGRVVIAPDQVLAMGLSGQLPRIERRATGNDLEPAHDH